MTISDNRTILRIGGEDRLEFLQDLVTNDVSRLEDGLVYAALLTPQGKYLADFLLFDEGDAVLLDVAAALADGLLQRLTLYRLRAKVTLERTDLGLSRGTGPAPDGALADPRHPALGWRLYGEARDSDESGWNAIRVEHVVPQALIELQPNESYILETGFERLHGVDFRKGCYVGQEIVARMKHKTELRKGLARVQIEGDAQPGTPITADGRPAGTLHTRAGDRAIAYLRFDRAQGPMMAGDATVRLDWIPDAGS